jgi:hypothetical protein
MPFFDDTGIDTQAAQGPFWGAFATLRDQLERLIVLNIAWSIQLLPGVAALAFAELPAWARLLMLAYSGLAIAPATGALYALARLAAQGEPLSLELATGALRSLALPSFRVLAPLYSTLGAACAAIAALDTWRAAGTPPSLLALDVGLRLALLLGLTCASYWGPLFAQAPEQAPAALLRQSALLVWRYPGRALLIGGAVLLVLAIGAISVGGLFLVVPVLAALLQTHMFLSLRQDQGGNMT